MNTYIVGIELLDCVNSHWEVIIPANSEEEAKDKARRDLGPDELIWSVTLVQD